MPHTKNKIVFADNLKKLLQQEGVSISQLSRKTNINKSTLHNYINGVLPQGLIALLRISQFFKIPIEELIFNHEDNITKKISTYEGRYEITVRKLHE